MSTYNVYLWKTIVLEVKVEADSASDASDDAMENFARGDYDGKWADAETTKVEAICDESNLVVE